MSATQNLPQPQTGISTPRIWLESQGDVNVVHAAGVWNVAQLAGLAGAAALGDLKRFAKRGDVFWNLTKLVGIDHLGALVFWREWGRRIHPLAVIQDEHLHIFENLAQTPPPGAENTRRDWLSWVVRLGSTLLSAWRNSLRVVILFGQFLIDLARAIRHPSRAPWKEISANIYRAGAEALPITALVGFLIGIVLSYLSAQQLKAFGAGVFIVDLLGVAIIRELGPVLAAILVAGRSGSAMTAQIGVMRVTEELDALHVMGIPRGYRLVMPKVLALALVMPLLIVWTDIWALFGGMVAAQLQLGMELRFFFEQLPNVVRIPNFWIGVGKGVVFGILIALVACHCGLRVAPNTESLAKCTTQSVVASITLVILVDALFAIIFQNVGL
jgi:phospholipid/cholesterol/gamma-HCH transport system permease protein